MEPPNLCVSSHLWNGKLTTKFQIPYDADVSDVVNIMVTVNDIERDANGEPFISLFTLKGAPEAEEGVPPPSGTRPAGTKRKDDGKNTSAQLAPPDIHEVRKGQKTYDDFKFDDFSALKINHGGDDGDYTFFVNMDNRFLINELHKTKLEEHGLVKHWFKYGVVFCALGIIKESERRAQELDTEEEDRPEQTDLKKVGRAGLARVIVPIIRALHKGPTILETAAQRAAA